MPQRSLYISELDHWMDEPFLSKVFHDLGYGSSLTKIKIGRDKVTDQPANYAFLQFSTRPRAEEVMETLKDQPIPNSSKTFKLRWATFSGSRQEDAGNRTVAETQIYVSGFDLATTQTTLMQFFKSKYPSVCFSKIHVDPITKVPKGFGFVHFNNNE